ncbi:MAG TPA: hypothetical protein PKC76_12820 [Saprospiraceae bacterium]|nr:hypothetical protein [Saprospiraceae bacterium]HMP25013.1 hypothetical protein [Saprospiraceae bacterium]
MFEQDNGCKRPCFFKPHKGIAFFQPQKTALKNGSRFCQLKVLFPFVIKAERKRFFVTFAESSGYYASS